MRLVRLLPLILTPFGGAAAVGGIALGAFFAPAATDLWDRLTGPPACVDGYLANRTPARDVSARMVIAGVTRGDGAAQDLVTRSLERLYLDAGVAVSVEKMTFDGAPCALPLPEGDRAASLAAARAEGRRVLAETRADVLIWGEATGPDAPVELRFVTPESAARGDFARAEDGLTLDPAFAEQVGALIVARMVSLSHATQEERGGYLADVMAEAARIISPLIANPPPGLSDGAAGALFEAFASANYSIGGQSGASLPLLEAISAYKIAIAHYQTAGDAWQVARTQNNLGVSLATLGRREAGTARLEEAVAAFRAALEELTRERVPLDWAMTQNNLGAALKTLGERETETARLVEAVAAYRAALKEWTRERVPLNWAGTQNNLGNALRTLGEREAGTARLEEAVAAYRKALEEWTRDRVPLDWAATQYNLSLVLEVIGRRGRDLGAAREAVTTARAARDLFAEAGHAAYLPWAERQLAETEALVAELEGQ